TSGQPATMPAHWIGRRPQDHRPGTGGMTMTHTLNPSVETSTDLDDLARLLTPDGRRISDRQLDPWIEDLDIEALRGLYRDMALLRRLDTEGVALQRQGQLGLWAPAQG